MSMRTKEPSSLDRVLAKFCEFCPTCLHARHYQKGVVFGFVKNVEEGICPFCQAYERVHGKKAHER